MATTVLVVQGTGELDAPEGTIVLVRYLERRLPAEDTVLAPELPDAASDPRFEPWAKAIRATLEGIEGPVQIVGHSFGGSVVVRLLGEQPISVELRSLHLVAMPWWGADGWGWDELDVPDDLAGGLPPVPTFLYHSIGDPHVPFAHLAFWRNRLPDARPRTIAGAEHSFRDGLPELIQDILETR